MAKRTGSWTKSSSFSKLCKRSPACNTFQLHFVVSRLIALATVLLPFCSEPAPILYPSAVALATCAPRSSWHLALTISAMIKLSPEFICKRSFKRDYAFVWNIFSCIVFLRTHLPIKKDKEFLELHKCIIFPSSCEYILVGF